MTSPHALRCFKCWAEAAAATYCREKAKSEQSKFSSRVEQLPAQLSAQNE